MAKRYFIREELEGGQVFIQRYDRYHEKDEEEREVFIMRDEEDAISRKAMLDYQEHLHGKMSNEENYKMWEFIKALQSIASAPKKGKWIQVTNGRGGHECSLCHSYAPSYQNGNEYLSAFCPNCGSVMMEE
jgi:hypothetical protein